jgi:hypothetical protein
LSKTDDLLPSQILLLAKSIRFCGIVDKFGTIIDGKYRENFQHLLTDQEERKQVLQAAIRNSSKPSWESKLGKARYSTTLYEKVITVTIPLWEAHFLFVTFDGDADDYDNCNKKDNAAG